MDVGWVYREIMYGILEKNQYHFTLKELDAGSSMEAINYATQRLEGIEVIKRTSDGFEVTEPKKLLNYWATIWNPKDHVVYKTRVPKKVDEIEGMVPKGSLLTAYSGFKLTFNEMPADYSEVWVYGEEKAFEDKFGEPEFEEANLIVVQIDEHLKKFKTIPIGQIYVDLWNLSNWNASVFTENLEKKIDKILEGTRK